MPIESHRSNEVRPPHVQPTASDRADDLALVQRLANNCEATWCEFVSRFAGQVRARVIRVTKSCCTVDQSAFADDILAEVFRALLANDHATLRAYQGRCSLCTYLCAIATRVALRYCIKAGSSMHSEDALATLADAKLTSPEHHLIDDEKNLWLLRHVEKLPAKQRQLIRLFHLEGKSYKEISDQLMIPIGSIGPSIGRAEALLRQMLGEDFLS